MERVEGMEKRAESGSRFRWAEATFTGTAEIRTHFGRLFPHLQVKNYTSALNVYQCISGENFS